MSTESKAVFLSYASQDVEAARRICESLRATGVEVWFDQSELRGGDSWDAKIRKQIRECALFVPVISAATQARLEGYFRLEWKLAEDRSHLIAKSRAFIVPVVIDGTSEREAQVPETFLGVQWTRLPEGGRPRAESGSDPVLTAFAGRVEQLLAPDLETGRPRPGRRDEGVASPAKPRAGGPKRRSPLAFAAATGVLLLGAGAWFRISRSEIPATLNPEPKTLNASGGSPAAPSEVSRLLALAEKILLSTELGENELNAAARLGENALKLEPQNADALALGSLVDSFKVQYVAVNTTNLAESTEGARTKSAEALSLAPQSFAARRARAAYLVCVAFTPASVAEAEPILRALRSENPGDNITLLLLGLSLRFQRKVDEAVAVFDDMARLPGAAAVAQSEAGWALVTWGRWREAEAAVDRSLAAQAFTGNVNLKVHLALRYRGDGEAALAAVDKLPTAMLLDDRGIAAAVMTYRWRREPQKLRQLLERVARDWIGWSINGPKTALTGDAWELENRPDLARGDWLKALSLVDKRLEANPSDRALLGWRAYLLVALGDAVKSAEALKKWNELPGRSGGITMAYDLQSRIVLPETALANLETALANLETTAGGASPGPMFNSGNLRMNPAHEKIRTTPRFQAVLSRLEAIESAPKVTP